MIALQGFRRLVVDSSQMRASRRSRPLAAVLDRKGLITQVPATMATGFCPMVDNPFEDGIERRAAAPCELDGSAGCEVLRAPVGTQARDLSVVIYGDDIDRLDSERATRGGGCDPHVEGGRFSGDPDG